VIPSFLAKTAVQPYLDGYPMKRHCEMLRKVSDVVGETSRASPSRESAF
jgi:hypothetical protein